MNHLCQKEIYIEQYLKKLSNSEKIIFQVLYYADKLRLSEINFYLNKKPKDIIATVKL